MCAVYRLCWVAVIATALHGIPCHSQDELPETATLGSLWLEYEALSAQTLKPAQELDELYAGNLEKLRTEATESGNLQHVLAVKAELEGFREGASPEAPQDFPALRRLQGIYRAERSKRLAAAGEARRPLREEYHRKLGALQVRLTRQGKIEEAVEVSKAVAKIEEHRATNAAPEAVAAPPAALARKDGFSNRLGMAFVPVPGTDVLFCIHETRHQDYAAYAEENSNIDSAWKNQVHDRYEIPERAGEHPVVRVSWDDANAFCAWLSRKEGKTYRLPTDREWSAAVGLGRKERWSRDDTPLSVAKDQDEFPWGREWPPPAGAGNYSDQSRKMKAPVEGSDYLNHDDGFPTTAPVMSFPPNSFGLHDMGGNVWEWVEDRYSNGQGDRVLRGAAFPSHERHAMLSSYRRNSPQGARFGYGFRVVVETDRARR